ncbi:Membrane-bound protein LytA precursor [compost metagenome]
MNIHQRGRGKLPAVIFTAVIAVVTALMLSIGGLSVFAEPSPIHVPGYEKSAAGGLTPAVKKQSYGIYEGLADGHTVEISVYGEPVDLQFTEALEPRLDSLEEGSRVMFIYTEQRVKGDDVVRVRKLLSIREAAK